MNDISDHLPIFTIREENLVISNDALMVSYMKVRNKGKKNMNILREKLVMFFGTLCIMLLISTLPIITSLK